MIGESVQPKFLSALALTACLPAGMALAADAPGQASRVEGFKGYEHPNQFIARPTVRLAGNMLPVVQHLEQDKQARKKLAELEKKTGKKPNVMVFLLDDVGWMDVGFNGGGIAVGTPTPDIDAIAAGGLILTSAYSQPSCSPTRATIMTGQYPVHHGINIPPMYGQEGGLDGAVTIAKLLKDQGYVTQAIGKWHLGENKASFPQNVGFDDFRGFLSVSDMYTEWRDPAFNPEVALSPSRTKLIQSLPFNKHDVHAVSGGDFEALGEITPKYMEDLDQRWAEYGVKFLKKMEKSDKPFFLYFGTRGCHFDNYPNERYLGSSPARNTFTDTMVEMNDIFATLYNTLKETGQLENTLILFTSDNGPEAEVAPHGRSPFRGAKGSTWEGGVRVPTFAYWKGMIEPRKSEGLFDLADLFCTFLSIAGKPGAAIGSLVPATTFIDGIDQASFFLAPEGQSSRRAIHYFWNGELAGVRMDEFKLLNLMQDPYSITHRGFQGGFTGTVVRAAGVMMFNLYANPQEDVSIGIRHLPVMGVLSQEITDYGKILEKFPPVVKIGI